MKLQILRWIHIFFRIICAFSRGFMHSTARWFRIAPDISHTIISNIIWALTSISDFLLFFLFLFFLLVINQRHLSGRILCSWTVVEQFYFGFAFFTTWISKKSSRLSSIKLHVELSTPICPKYISIVQVKIKRLTHTSNK